ncbi:hypothetical protein MRB53_023690 [Persea americana]|uniref:Uncharacterized protein n=1 Tax=Persea americana TaxID=3435 RepID=A0ACC2LAH0_PERAE|nr:hypothetical protein MRB53_023690 [Persea americana]
MAVVSTSERLAMDDGDDGGGAALQSTLVLAVLVFGARTMIEHNPPFAIHHERKGEVYDAGEYDQTSTLGMKLMKLKVDTGQRTLQQVNFKKSMMQVNMANT